jgi:hypothetical protein
MQHLERRRLRLFLEESRHDPAVASSIITISTAQPRRPSNQS